MLTPLSSVVYTLPKDGTWRLLTDCLAPGDKPGPLASALLLPMFDVQFSFTPTRPVGMTLGVLTDALMLYGRQLITPLWIMQTGGGPDHTGLAVFFQGEVGPQARIEVLPLAHK